MNKNKIIIVFVLLTFLMSGCIGINSDFKHIRNSLMQLSNNRFDKEIEFSVGSFGLMVAGAFVSLANTEVNIEDMLDQITGVQIGIYETRGSEINFSLDRLREISNYMKEEGWRYLVRTVNSNEMNAVYINVNDAEKINRVFIIAFSNEELVLTQVSGNLEKLIEIAIKDRGLKFNIAEN